MSFPKFEDSISDVAQRIYDQAISNALDENVKMAEYDEWDDSVLLSEIECLMEAYSLQYFFENSVKVANAQDAFLRSLSSCAEDLGDKPPVKIKTKEGKVIYANNFYGKFAQQVIALVQQEMQLEIVHNNDPKRQETDWVARVLPKAVKPQVVKPNIDDLSTTVFDYAIEQVQKKCKEELQFDENIRAVIERMISGKIQLALTARYLSGYEEIEVDDGTVLGSVRDINSKRGIKNSDAAYKTFAEAIIQGITNKILEISPAPEGHHLN